MEKLIQCVQGIERVNIFGVRHLSPAASHHLLRLLEKLQPTCVLIEGPSDATSLIPQVAGKGVVPPVAILAYTVDLPVDTVLYPFAEYSPEYQAILWAKEKARFMDLPTGVLLSLNKWQREEENTSEEENAQTDMYYQKSWELYSKVALLDHSVDADDYHEKNFEHNLHEGSYNTLMQLNADEMRTLLEPIEALALPNVNARDLVREAYMAMQIQLAMEEGHQPEKIVVITGAYHAKRLLSTIPMTQEEFASLPFRDSKMTLMPYSFYRLSARSGYGAGNNAPAYYQLMWECMKSGVPESLPYKYLSRLGRFIRENGGYCSTANVIEAVRLAQGLAYLKEGNMPTLADLHQAAIACIGHGEQSQLAPAFAMMDFGTTFGELPEGISQTPIQDDFNRQLKSLKLEKYKSTVATELELDLRENIKVKSPEAAFMDLNRSTFLNRLAFLGVGFAKKVAIKQDGATWREKWILQWSPEIEVQLVESTLKGESIELAAAFALKEQLDNCNDVQAAAKLISIACICKLTTSIPTALSTLQGLTAEANDFVKTADACYLLSQLIQYGDLRRFETEPLIPLLARLFLRAALLLTDYANCNDEAATVAISAVNAMHNVSQENFDTIDDETWIEELLDLASRDDKNPKLSGIAFALLLERGIVDEDFCAKEVSRRLSPGIPADIGAGWFEGMSLRNRYALLSRVSLWKELDIYIQSLDDDEFKRSVVFMRRAFSSFEAKEKNSVAELLSELWSMDSQDVSILLQEQLAEADLEALDTLNDFDFDS